MQNLLDQYVSYYFAKYSDAAAVHYKDDVYTVDEGECLVFVKAAIVEEFTNLGTIDRAAFENMAFEWLKSHNIGSKTVRFDLFEIRETDERQALIRHHKNALSAGIAC